MEIKKIAEEQEIWDDNEEVARLEEKAKKIVVRIENDGLGFYFILFYFILFYFSFIFSYLVENKTKKTKCDRKEIAQWKSLYPYILCLLQTYLRLWVQFLSSSLCWVTA